MTLIDKLNEAEGIAAGVADAMVSLDDIIAGQEASVTSWYDMLRIAIAEGDEKAIATRAAVYMAANDYLRQMKQTKETHRRFRLAVESGEIERIVEASLMLHAMIVHHQHLGGDFIEARRAANDALFNGEAG